MDSVVEINIMTKKKNQRKVESCIYNVALQSYFCNCMPKFALLALENVKHVHHNYFVGG